MLRTITKLKNKKDFMLLLLYICIKLYKYTLIKKLTIPSIIREFTIKYSSQSLLIIIAIKKIEDIILFFLKFFKSAINKIVNVKNR